jgi:hypothetical protein
LFHAIKGSSNDILRQVLVISEAWYNIRIRHSAGVAAVVTNSLENAFKEAEASLRLEGLELDGDEQYQNLKRRLLEKKLSFDEARAEIIKAVRQGGA